MKPILILFAFSPIGLFAQTSFDAASIADSLKTEAHAVVRVSKQSLVVSSLSKAVCKVHQVVTVLDERGRRDLFFASYSSSFEKLEDADIYVYDAKGALVQHVRQNQMSQSGYGDGLIDDAVYTYFAVTAPAFPITVQMDYTISFKGAIRFPDFILDNVNRSIQDAEYTLTLSKNMGVRYRNHLLSLEPRVSEDKNTRTYTWKVSGIRAIPSEAGAPSDNIPRVYIDPTQFEMGGHQGDLSTWSQFGQWIYDLNKPTYGLPEASKQFYRDMVKNAPTDLDKARLIYRYLQQNFRYVSIQLGIGGFRSFPASFTEEKKYGDCKGLSTYMSACLDAIGIKSYTALINAGYGMQPVDPAYPRDGFNHMIVCIPRPGDSVWLECTSKHTDFGVLSGFTENRNALLITEHGGVLVHTPSTTPVENSTHTFTRVSLADDGSGTVTLSRAVSGENKVADLSGLPEADRDAQKNYLVNVLDLPQPNTFSVHLQPADTALLRSDIHLTYDKIPEFTAGAKMFLNPQWGHIWRQHMPGADHRRSAYCFGYPFVTMDTTCYQLPEGFVVDQLPKGRSLSCPYATYSSAYRYDTTSRAVYCVGVLTLKIRVIPAGDYPEVRRFFGSVVEDETEKVVINKP